MKPEHLSLLRTPGRPTVHPGGEWAVVAVTRPDLEADAYRSRLWRIPLDGGPAVALTAGPNDSQPVVSPDGRWLAFLRGGDGPPQLAVVDTRGGEPRVLTSHRLGVTGRPAWSPDSSRLAYTAPVPEEGRFGTVDGVGAEAEPARHITTFTYRSDGAGFTIGRPTHVHVVDLPLPAAPIDGEPAAPAPLRLTDGDAPFRDAAWLADGSGLLALRGRADALVTELVRLGLPAAPDADEAEDAAAADDAATGDVPTKADRERDGVLVPVPRTPVELGRAGLTVEAFGVVPQDDVAPAAADESDAVGHGLVLLVADLGPDGLGFIGTNPSLWRGVLRGAAVQDVAVLTDPESDDLAGGTGEAGFGLLADGGVLLRRVRRGRTELVSVDGAGSVRIVHPGSVTGAVALPDGRVVASATLPDSPGEVLLIEAATLDAGGEDGITRLTDLAAPLRAELGAGGVRRSLEVRGAVAPDGYPLHGWVVLPDPAVHGEGPYPVLLSVHGGPYAQYEDVFFDEVQVSAGAGYAVVYGNPRGSAGYGSAHGRSIIEGFGTLDADDVLGLLDAALAAHPELDASRVGVTGGSYGGYMAAWLTTRPDAGERFRGAIVERGFLDPVSFEGSSDIGWFFGLRYLGEDAESVAAQSPMARIGDVVTPTLVIHSEHDWRCPVEQGQRWYVGLRRRGVEAELLLFPGEGHELSRSGRPKHRLQRFRAVLDWWERQLR